MAAVDLDLSTHWVPNVKLQPHCMHGCNSFMHTSAFLTWPKLTNDISGLELTEVTNSMQNDS